MQSSPFFVFVLALMRDDSASLVVVVIHEREREAPSPCRVCLQDGQGLSRGAWVVVSLGVVVVVVCRIHFRADASRLHVFPEFRSVEAE